MMTNRKAREEHLKGVESTLGAPLPRRQTIHSAGYDFYLPHDIRLLPREWTTFSTGIRFTDDISPGVDRWVMELYPRSSYSLRYGLRIRNTVPIIDQDYRGEIMMSLTADVPLDLKAGDRVVQGIFKPYLVLDGEIEPESVRDGGIGSTGE